jgi:predicted peptidase
VIPASASAFEPGEVVTPLIDKYESREQVAPHATLKYRLFVPEPYDPDESYPLVLTLHGFGESGSDNELQLSANQLSTAFADPAWQKRHPAFVVSPQLDAGTGPGAWAQAHNQAALLAMLDSLREEFSIDSRRIYLVGLSMGSHGAWDLLGASPQTFAGALLIAYGGGPLVTLTDVPLWNIQSIDDDIVPYTSSVDAARVLEDAGAVVTHSEFPGNLSRGQATEAALEQWREADETQSRILFTAFTPQTTGLPGEPPLTGHPSWVDVFSNEVYLEWLFSKSRPPAPAPYASPGWPIAIAGVAGVLVATALVLWRRGKRARA